MIHSFLLGLIYAQPKISKESIQINILPEVRNQIERLYQQDPEERARAARILGEMGSHAGPAVPFLIDMLGDEYPVLSRNGTKTMESTTPAKEAAVALGRIGKPSAEPLSKAFRKEGATIRKKIVQVLGKIQDQYVSKTLIGALNDEDILVQCAAIEALGERKDALAVEPLSALLRHKKSKIQQAAQVALSKIVKNMKDSQAVEPLLNILQSKDHFTRSLAIGALADTKDTRAVEPLIGILKDQDANGRAEAAKALGNIRDSRAILPLIDALSDNDSLISDNAAKALVEIGSPAVEPLILAFQDRDVNRRAKIVNILGKIKDNRAVMLLIDAIIDKSRIVRSQAAIALGNIKDPCAISPLINALHDRNAHVREVVSKALVEIGKSAVQPLIMAFQEGDIKFRSAIISILGEIKDDRAVIPLIEILNDDASWALRSEAAKALGNICDPRALIPLTDAINDKDPYVRDIAAGALEKIKNK